MNRIFMLLAISEAKKNLKKMDGGPFGACIVKGGKVLAAARNTVLRDDASCHAEVNAIRIASRKLKTFDLSGCEIYSTTEPCPMCFSAIHWARIDKVIFGTDTKDAKKIGFNELMITDSRLKTLGKSKVKIVRGFMRRECLELFGRFNELPKKKLY
ncbi:MAG: nucleoside deaminase [Candidatus Omnitrophota bacterium]|jgi:tRNA(Arg) A34 adenosine deaminase TadA